MASPNSYNPNIRSTAELETSLAANTTAIQQLEAERDSLPKNASSIARSKEINASLGELSQTKNELDTERSVSVRNDKYNTSLPPSPPPEKIVPPVVEEKNQPGADTSPVVPPPKVSEDPSPAMTSTESARLDGTIADTSYPPGIGRAEASPLPSTPDVVRVTDTTTLAGVNQASYTPTPYTPYGATPSTDDATPSTNTASATAVSTTSDIPEYKPTVNLLHDYASYSYNISLHALSTDDYTTMMENPELPYKPTSVLIASAGRYGENSNMKRHKEFANVDFFFDNLNLETVIGMSSQNKNTNAIQISFTIIEPYGVTLLNRIMNVCQEIKGENFREMPYLLQIDFFGYSDDGIPQKIKNVSKMIPIKFIEFKIKLSVKGAEYAITAMPFNHIAFTETIASTPTKLEVVAATVEDFFLAKDKIPEELKNKDKQTISGRRQDEQILEQNNRDQQKENDEISKNTTRNIMAAYSERRNFDAANKILKDRINGALQVHSYTGAVNAWHEALITDKKVNYSHVIAFEIDPDIAKASFPKAKYISPGNLPMAPTINDKSTQDAPLNGQSTGASQSNTPIDQISTTTKIYSANPDTRIIPINQGTSIIEVIGQVVRSSSYITDQLADPVNKTAYDKRLAEIEDKGLDWFKITPRIKLLSYDEAQNTYAKKITYLIEKCKVYNTKSKLAPQGEPKGYVKEYNYMYTGENKDVINLDITFDTLYYVAQTTAAVNKEADSGAQNTVDDFDIIGNLDDITKAEAKERKTSKADRGLQHTNSNINTTAVAGQITNKDDVPTQIQNQLLASPGGDMIQLNLKIVGDPDFIKQDDFFYPTPKIEQAEQSNYKTPNGSILMDTGEIFVNLTFKTPSDYNDETGLATPGTDGYNSSIFSGRYKVLTVKSIFSGGKFEQELNLIRYPNQETQGIKPKLKSATNAERHPSVGEDPDGTRTDDPSLVTEGWAGPTTQLGGGSPVPPAPDSIASKLISTGADAPLSNDTSSFRAQMASAPTVSLGADLANSASQALSGAKSMAASAIAEVQGGLAKISTGALAAVGPFQQSLAAAAKVPGALPSLPLAPNSNLAAVINQAQSATATAVGNIPTPTLPGTGGRF